MLSFTTKLIVTDNNITDNYIKNYVKASEHVNDYDNKIATTNHVITN